MTTKVSGVVATVAFLAAVIPASSNPIQYGSDEFLYVTSPSISWADAEADAASLTYKGLPGYLAVITSSAENAFLTSNFTISTTSFEGAWLGGECFAPSAACYWETGPLAGKQFSLGQTSVGGAYVNFGGIEPNNAPSAIYLNIGYSGYDGIGNGQWADAAGGVTTNGYDPVQGYIVEFSPTTPLPAALPLFATGLGLVGLLGWRRKRKNATAR